MNYKLLLAADHAGYEMKEALKIWLKKAGYKVEDLGTESPEPEDDYPDFVLPLARKVHEDPTGTRGIICAGSGEGEAMAANRYKGVRATVYYAHNTEIARLSREHNNSNIFAIGARFVNHDQAKEALSIWLKTDFSDDPKYKRRIDKVENLIS